MKYNTFGERLREYRRMVGLNQSQLGSLLNLSQDTISLWEQNKSKPDFDSIILMCDIFSISADELLGIDIIK